MTRVWFGPADSELLGDDALRRPVVGNEDGVTTMQELKHVSDVAFELNDDDATSRDVAP